MKKQNNIEAVKNFINAFKAYREKYINLAAELAEEGDGIENYGGEPWFGTEDPDVSSRFTGDFSYQFGDIYNPLIFNVDVYQWVGRKEYFHHDRKLYTEKQDDTDKPVEVVAGFTQFGYLFLFVEVRGRLALIYMENDEDITEKEFYVHMQEDYLTEKKYEKSISLKDWEKLSEAEQESFIANFTEEAYAHVQDASPNYKINLDRICIELQSE